MKKIFLSFASEDTDFILRLFFRLKSLDLDVWDYTNKNEEIHLGDKISESLKFKIENSEFFIPVITKNSVAEQKIVVQFEIGCALENKLEILPIVLTNRPPDKWRGNFAYLSDTKYLDIELDNDHNFESKIIELCAYLDTPYKPLISDPNKLPLFKKLEKEICSLLDAFGDLRKRAEYEKIMRVVQKFNLAYSLGKWQESLKHISYLIEFIEYETQTIEIYYPKIVKGSVELMLNKLDDAEKTFLDAKRNENFDENCEGGLGQVFFKRKQYKESFYAYYSALEKNKSEINYEIQYNLILSALELVNHNSQSISGDSLSLEVYNVLNNVDERLKESNFHTPKETIQINHVKSLAYLKLNNIHKATELLDFCLRPIATLPKYITGELESHVVSPQLQYELAQKKIDITLNLKIAEIVYGNRLFWHIADFESNYILKKNSEGIVVYYFEVAILIDYVDLLIGDPTWREDVVKRLTDYCFFANSRSLYQRLASLNLNSNRVDEALKIYETNLCVPPLDPELLIQWALILRSQHSILRMTDVCKQIIRLGNPKSLSDWYNIGFAHFLNGETKEAKFYFDKSGANFGYYSSLI